MQRAKTPGWVLGTVLLLAPAAASAADNLYVPVGGGYWNVPANWSLGHCPLPNESVKILVSGAAVKDVEYDWTGASTFSSVKIDGNGNYYGAIWHDSNLLTTYNMYVGDVGPAWHWMEGPAYLWVNEFLYVGFDDPGPGHFYLATNSDGSAGLYVGDLCYVGYQGPGDFDHRSGIAQIHRLYIGQSATATYYLRNGRLEVDGQIVIGNGAEGTMDQANGTFVQAGTNGIIMGLNTGGAGTYLMSGGTLDVHHISLAWNGNAYFTQSGGTVTTVGDVNLGCQGTHPMQAWYKLNQNSGTAVLNVGGDLLVAPQTYAKYEQTAGTCNVTGNLEIWKGTTSGSSYVYLGTSAGLLDVGGEVINHTGYYDQDGGVMTTSHFTNDSTQGINIDNNADFRATNLTNNAGSFTMWRNAILRGELALPPSTYWMCNFTNNATFQMGSAASNGGSFRGILTNNGTFNYFQGDFSVSSLLNYGTFNINADFACRRIVNESDLTLPSDRSITADGAGFANAVENNGGLFIQPRGHINVGGTSKLVNNGRMYAGGPGTDLADINGDMENNNYLIPCHSSLASGKLLVTGDFTGFSGSELRIRIRGAAPADYDQLAVGGRANLYGELNVRFTSAFVPSIGQSFTIITYGSRHGSFNQVTLPALPIGREWQLNFGASAVVLSVIETFFGDMNCDSQVDQYDVGPFVLALISPQTYQATIECHIDHGDINHDGAVDGQDIQPFVNLLLTP